MSYFKEPSFADRQKAALEARKSILDTAFSKGGKRGCYGSRRRKRTSAM